MAHRFYHVEDAVSKLNRTVCLWKNEPYYIKVDADIHYDIVHGLHLKNPNGDYEKINYTSDDFSYDIFDLGYFFQRGKAYYVTRIPRRIHTEGLRPQNVVPEIFGDRSFISVEFYNCIKGIHVPLAEAIAMLDGDDTVSVPFHRHGAVKFSDRFNNRLLFKGHEVGIVQGSEIILYRTSSPAYEKTIRKTLGLE